MSAGPEAVCVNCGRWRGQGGAAEPPGKVSGGKEGDGSLGRPRGDRACGGAGGRVGAGLGEGRHLPGPPAGRGRAGTAGRLGPGPDRTFPPPNSWLGGGASTFFSQSAKEASPE